MADTGDTSIVPIKLKLTVEKRQSIELRRCTPEKEPSSRGEGGEGRLDGLTTIISRDVITHLEEPSLGRAGGGGGDKRV